jgi:hypothetical protein
VEVCEVAELNKDDLRRLARLGAMKRLEDLKAEEAAIRGAFPELFRAGSRALAPPAAAPRTKLKKRRPMSAGERKSVSERMKKYWAERRKAKR